MAAEASANDTTATADVQLVCPDCGKTFARAASLGAHRRQAHGVAGSSANARQRRSPSGRRATRRGGARAATAARSNGAEASRPRGGVDRDALLSALFPKGIPPREDVVRSVNSWLDEAERLARL